jgi:hypothetical protein
VLILGASGDQQQERRLDEAVHQAVQDRLRLMIAPVQILAYQDHGLHLALAQ